MTADGAAELVEAMLDPGFYPGAPERVELRETATSWVFLVGNLAYKVKRPIVRPFLDYGSPERRREMCEAELRLNSRLAPDYYLRVESVVAQEGRFALASADDPAALEYVVVMRRVPEHRTLAGRIAAGGVEPGQIEAVGRRLARFHRRAEPAPARATERDWLQGPLLENVATLLDVGSSLLPRDRLAAMERFTVAFLDSRAAEIAERARNGLVRDCHGDLRAEHVILDAEISIFDCIEFDDRLRWIDVAADLAFLVMDLWRLREPELAARLAAAYRGAGGDAGGDALLYGYAAYRAWVRSKVSCLGPGDEARPLLSLGHRLAWRARGPLLVAVCGVAASGKTTLAEALAEHSGLPRVSSDIVRKRLAGLKPTERAAAEHYSDEFNRRTYAELGRLALAELDRAGGAIVDATCRRATDRDAFRATLKPIAPPLLFAECRAPAPVLLRRAAERTAAGRSVSDADLAVVERQLGEFEPLEEVAPDRRIAVDTTRPLAEAILAVEQLADGLLFD